MIERLRRWWRGLPDDKEMQDDVDQAVKEMDASVPASMGVDSEELRDTKRLIKESGAKLKEADVRINDYQARIRRETKKRLEYTSGGRYRDNDPHA